MTLLLVLIMSAAVRRLACVCGSVEYGNIVTQQASSSSLQSAGQCGAYGSGTSGRVALEPLHARLGTQPGELALGIAPRGHDAALHCGRQIAFAVEVFPKLAITHGTHRGVHAPLSMPAVTGWARKRPWPSATITRLFSSR